MSIPVHYIIAAVIWLAGCAAAAYGGWDARGVVADRDANKALAAERAETITLQGVALSAEQGASKRGAEYANKAAALQPIIREVHSQTQTVIKELQPCPLPPSVNALLKSAADAAER